MPILEHVAGWRSRNGCQDTPDVREMPDLFDEGTVVQRWDYAGCRAETLFYRIEGGGHTWPGSPVNLNPALGVKSLDLVATDSIVVFFLRQGL